MCTVFYKHRVEFLNTLQHRVESLWYSVILSSWLAGHVMLELKMLELKSIKVIHLLMTARQALRQLHYNIYICIDIYIYLSAPEIETPAPAPRSLVWLESEKSMPSERNKSACMMLTKNVCRGSLGDNTSEALVPLQVNTVCCTAI